MEAKRNISKAYSKFLVLFLNYFTRRVLVENCKNIKRICMNSRWIAQLFIVCFIIGLFVLAMNYNSYVLIKFSSQLFEMDLPEGVHVIEKYKVKGKLNGNGNGFFCLYFS